MADVQTLTNELQTLRAEFQKTIADRNAKREEIYSLPTYKEYETQMKTRKQRQYKIDEKIAEIGEDIANDYTTDANRPMFSVAWGKNIRLDVLQAIKQTFKDLRQSDIETIARRLLDDAISANLEVQKFREESKKLSLEIRDLADTRENLVSDNKIIIELDTKVQTLSAEIRIKEHELAKQRFTRGEIKSADVNSFDRKRVLNSYRHQAMSDYKKVAVVLAEIRAKDGAK